MSLPQIVLRPDLQRLVDEKFEVSVVNNHLVVSSIPYVTQGRIVEYGRIVCPVSDGKPDHTVFFQGETPCNAEGTPLEQVINNSNRQILFDRFEIQHYFSNKPSGVPNFPADYYEKVIHYIRILEGYAKLVDPDVDARTGMTMRSVNEDSVFRYGDSASARVGITAISQKLALGRVALVGLGGTGGYILDHVAKTPVKEIHLFDGDVFSRHNAFRAPGAASFEELQEGSKKVEYFQRLYGRMRSGIVTHSHFIDETNVSELESFDFVFVAVDNGPARGLVGRFLLEHVIPFIDVGMGLDKVEGELSIRGGCRVTLCTPKMNQHFDSCVDTHDDREEALYSSNIQVSDFNALNATLAVMKWKQFFGFYSDSMDAHQIGFAVGLMSLSKDVSPGWIHEG